MTGRITVYYDKELMTKRTLLEEIVRQTTPTAKDNDITIEIRYGTRTITDEEYDDGRTCFACTEVDDEAGTGTITLYNEGKSLTPLAFQGLVYNMIGTVFGVCLYDFMPENKEKDLFSEQNTPKREAVFDFLMLKCGGTIEALVAYRFETEKKLRQTEREKEKRVEGGFGTYCATLDKLQEGLGTKIYNTAKMTEQQKAAPTPQIICEN